VREQDWQINIHVECSKYKLQQQHITSQWISMIFMLLKYIQESLSVSPCALNEFVWDAGITFTENLL